jgi:phenylacetate-CoA ligase
MIREILEFRRILRNHKLPPSQMRLLQERKLRAVIRNAYDHVPYYQSLFRSAGLSPEDIRTLEDLRKVPVTTKEDLRAAGIEKITADWADLSECTVGETSGSTGPRFTVYRSKTQAGSMGLRMMAALRSAGFRTLDRLALMRLDVPLPRRFHHRLGLFRSEAISPYAGPDEQIRRLGAFQPTVVFAYPAMLRDLMHNADRPLSEFFSPKVLITALEHFDEVLKKRIQADVDADLINFYLTMEFGLVAWECHSHRGLHLNADQLILECVDNEKPVDSGEAGVAVGTSLVAFAMPFIRYRLGDFCRFSSSQKCSCGCSLPLIDHPIRREVDTVVLPSGKTRSALEFGKMLAESSAWGSIDQWRVIQENTEQLVLKLVLRTEPQAGILDEIRVRFLDYLEEPVNLDIEQLGYMEREWSKFPTFVSKVLRPCS